MWGHHEEGGAPSEGAGHILQGLTDIFNNTQFAECHHAPSQSNLAKHRLHGTWDKHILITLTLTLTFISERRA